MSFLKPSSESETVTVVGGALAAIVKACARIYDSLRRIEETLERIENVMMVERKLSPARHRTGLTDRLELTEEEQRLLRAQLHAQEVNDVRMINAFETFRREVRVEMRMYAPLSAQLWNWIKGRGKGDE